MTTPPTRPPAGAKLLVIGSGPIIIGQAAEFDYSGAQACRSLREEGYSVVLVNNNPATIMTDPDMADAVYFEPLTVDYVSNIIRKERPWGIVPTLGGQTGLNLAVDLARSGVLDECDVKLLGNSLWTIETAEDREKFRDYMQEIGEPVPPSEVVSTIEQGVAAAKTIGYPVILRPAFTLGGTGGGAAYGEDELRRILHDGLTLSPVGQVLVEKNLLGWRELEYEVIRDANDNCITICNMENMDPMGVHTGDSIVVAPSQTLTDKEYQLLRSSAIKIIRALKIQGGCNIQFALDNKSMAYYIIEVNPRVSRSSALASKATGYPIAKIAAKIAVGRTLDELPNPITGVTKACFEPALDYCVVKVPRWPFDKFYMADRHLGTQMKATGEVMAIARSFEVALLKAVRSLEMGVKGLTVAGAATWTPMHLENLLESPTDQRLFAIFEAFRRGMGVREVASHTGISTWFLEKIHRLSRMEKRLVETVGNLSDAELREAAQLGFTPTQMAMMAKTPPKVLRERFAALGLEGGFKMVDTCAGEFEARTPYFYSTPGEENEAVVPRVPGKKRVVVLGSGPIRIGQGVEFDYSCVHCVMSLQREGVEAIIINNNPETVSTDFDISTRLYFEPLFIDDVLRVLHNEQPDGVVVQFGGQTAINLARSLQEAGFTILGTSVNSIDRAEDRKLFDELLTELDIPRPLGKTVFSAAEAIEAAGTLGFPLVVRPSFVLGGQAMEIVSDLSELEHYIRHAVTLTPEHPVLIDRYFVGKEIEVDVISDGETVIIPGIMEHIERAGVHSGDSMAVYPPQTLSDDVKKQVVDYTSRMARALKVKGVLNIQYVVVDEQVFIFEANPRASRTVPFLSKVTGVPMVALATRALLGGSLKGNDYGEGLLADRPIIAVKAPAFSFQKLVEVDVALGPEMKSTGEVMGLDTRYPNALYKALVSSHFIVPPTGNVYCTIADRDKEEALPILRGFCELGYGLVATSGTFAFLEKNGIPCRRVHRVTEPSPTIVDGIRAKDAVLLINTLTPDRQAEVDGRRMRRASVETGVPCMTSLDSARALLYALKERHVERDDLLSIHAYAQR